MLWRWTSATPDAVAHARAALRCALDQLGYTGDAPDDAVLAVSELVANALEHAPGPYEVRLRWAAAGLICEVMDGDPCIPAIPSLLSVGLFEPAPDKRGGGLDALLEVLSERGRGLQIVHQLTSGAWGFSTERGKRTKVAWVMIPEGWAADR
ncbi:putative anti-sigma factor [Streptomyces sp. NBRC 110611]|nr:putative anti-sigma factor [Streptomyces sp. NBRC 110611]